MQVYLWMYQAKNTHVLYNMIMCDPDRVYHTEISDSYKPQGEVLPAAEHAPL